MGGVAGGATAAARARRLDEHTQIILFERNPDISFANCGLPYYLGGVIKRRSNLLLTTPKAFGDRYRIDVRVLSEVISIDRSQRLVCVRDLGAGRVYEESYDKLILAPGASPVAPPIPGIDRPEIFQLRSLQDMDRIKAFIDHKKPQTAVVVGAGFIGLEMAENLSRRGLSITIVEALDQVMATLDSDMAGLLENHIRAKGIDLLLNRKVSAFEDNRAGPVVLVDDGARLPADLVLLSIGIKPESGLAREAGLEVSTTGAIVVNAAMQTSDPDIYAVGDAVQIRDRITGQPTLTPLAGPANKQGRIAADNALGRASYFRGTLGTSIVKVFDLTAAVTGFNEKRLLKHNIPYSVSYTHSGSHASYYPGAADMAVKLLFAPADGKILGAQIIGPDGVDKRIDVLATALHGGMTVFDLEELELAYAPPYSSAKDPINIAGYAAANMIKGDHKTLGPADLIELDPEHDLLIDLRHKSELAKHGTIDGACHIPLPELRARLKDLDRSMNYILFCAAGYRGYLAHRILEQNGFKSKNLSGGHITYLGANVKRRG